jgi:hypothetical protein
MNRTRIHRRTVLLVVLGMSLIGGSVGAQSASERLVSMKDACDPTTFNAVLGPGAAYGQAGCGSTNLLLRSSAGAWSALGTLRPQPPQRTGDEILGRLVIGTLPFFHSRIMSPMRVTKRMIPSKKITPAIWKFGFLKTLSVLPILFNVRQC